MRFCKVQTAYPVFGFQRKKRRGEQREKTEKGGKNISILEIMLSIQEIYLSTMETDMML